MSLVIIITHIRSLEMMSKKDWRRALKPKPPKNNEKMDWIDWIIVGTAAAFIVWLLLTH